MIENKCVGKRAELNVYDDTMETDMKCVTLTLHYPINTPNKNGTTFTYDAVKNAFEQMKTKQVPIVDYTHNTLGKIIGVAIPSVYYETEDGCSISDDCYFFDRNNIKEFNMEYMINKFHKDQDGVTVIDDFKIMSMNVEVEEK